MLDKEASPHAVCSPPPAFLEDEGAATLIAAVEHSAICQLAPVVGPGHGRAWGDFNALLVLISGDTHCQPTQSACLILAPCTGGSPEPSTTSHHWSPVLLVCSSQSSACKLYPVTQSTMAHDGLVTLLNLSTHQRSSRRQRHGNNSASSQHCTPAAQLLWSLLRLVVRLGGRSSRSNCCMATAGWTMLGDVRRQEGVACNDFVDAISKLLCTHNGRYSEYRWRIQRERHQTGPSHLAVGQQRPA